VTASVRPRYYYKGVMTFQGTDPSFPAKPLVAMALGGASGARLGLSIPATSRQIQAEIYDGTDTRTQVVTVPNGIGTYLASLADPDVIAAEIVEDLRAALEEFELILQDLSGS